MNLSIKNVAKKLQLKDIQVEKTLKLLEQGCTVPFISRYRKNITEGLDEEQIAKIEELYKYDVELEKRKEAILNILEENKLLTDELKLKIQNASTKQELENIYEPFKIGKKTKASEAIAMGLLPLAEKIMSETSQDFNVFNECKKYFNDKLTTTEQVIEQVKYIIAQIISQDISTREFVKNNLISYGTVESKVKKDANDEKQVFLQYYDFKERVKFIPNHRILAISRGADKKILSYDISFNEKPIQYELKNKYFVNKRTAFIINDSIDDGLKRLIYPSIIREIKTDLFERAEAEAIKLFAKSVEQMLLAPAVKNKKVMAIDPAYVNGCKIAILDENGNFLEKAIIYPNPPKPNLDKAKEIVNKLLDKYESDLILIGNGTASHETKDFITNLLNWRKEVNGQENAKCLVVSEIGASVYSASKNAIEEFPNLSVEERSAISIGRRYQDPLNELVKIDPKAIGVGQYQHDVDQKMLENELEFKVNKVVNEVGVNLNTASEYILRYISGLTKTLAKKIVEHRNKIKEFTNREELKEIKGISDKVYEQAIGFLRLYNSNVFYDKTNIHPESYKLADSLVKYLNIDLSQIDKKLLQNIDKNKIMNDLKINEFDLNLIIDSLLNPGKDIRDQKAGFTINENITKAEDLHVGQIISGQVLNLTDFGAFVFIGIKQSVLVHVSHMKRTENEFINKPSDVLNIGDTVQIKILDIDLERNRIHGQIIW